MGSKGEATAVQADVVEAEVDFKEISVEDAYEILKTSEKGLTSDEARKRLEEYGPNKLPEESRNQFLVYLSYMWNPLSWAMEAAAILAIALLDYADFALIVGLLFVNATISYVEESNADKAIKALTAALAPRAKAVRDGEIVTIEACDLVPGDVILVRLGDIVPADIKLLGEHDETPLQVDQAALTGESLPVKKFKGDVAFSGSTIKQGERHAVVYATGMNTFFGRAAALLGQAEQVANIQKVMTKIGAVCLITIGVWVVILLGVQFGHYSHKCRAGVGGCPTLTNLLVVIVGGIPIAMPTVLSVTLALGAYKLAKEGAIVSRMSAVEEMAGMDILCSDKTGTLTLNKLTVDVANVHPLGGHTIEDVLRYGAMSANIITEEPIDMVLHNSYAGKDTLWDELKLAKFIPFNPTDKYTIAYVHDKDGKVERVMKGAPQVVVRNAHNKAEIEEECNKRITEYANRGFRALGIAKALGDGPATGDSIKWEMVGLVPLFDPPRHDTKETIEKCLEMGIHVKMITGDQLLIGKETARQLGMGQNMFTTETLLKAKAGTELVEGTASVEDLVEHADGFAEVFPEHKFMIVKLLQDRHHVCGMTGDGVNDAPALKKADVGIAVAGATDAARGAADIVLTDAGLSTIVTAVLGARKIFQRMTTYARYTIAMTFRICFTFGLLTVIYNWYFPTILIVLLAVFNDGAMIALSKDRVTPSHVPNRWDLQSIFITGIFYGLYLTLASWVLFHTAGQKDFFNNNLGMFSLNYKDSVVQAWCNDRISNPTYIDPAFAAKADLPGSICLLYGDQEGSQWDDCPAVKASLSSGEVPDTTLPSLTQQCMGEQVWFRQSMLRSLMYCQVSASGQALVFVVRTMMWSLLSRAGLATYIAFAGAQFAATMISLFGFNGYDIPAPGDETVSDCQFCKLSSGGDNPFFSRGTAPIYGTEAMFTSSCIGCTYYVVAAWVWVIIWHFGLDPLKWLLAYFMNEDGFRSYSLFETAFFAKGQRIGAAAGIGVNKHPEMRASVVRVSMARASAVALGRTSSLSRVSAVQMGNRFTGGIPGVGGSIVASPAMLERASMVRVQH